MIAVQTSPKTELGIVDRPQNDKGMQGSHLDNFPLETQKNWLGGFTFSYILVEMFRFLIYSI